MAGADVMLKRTVDTVSALNNTLSSHPLYSCISSAAGVRFFMEHHVFAVWDFMCLLKTLQAEFTCIDTVWRPVGDPTIRRMINEIVLCEESDDLDVALGYRSHLELYIEAMRECEADVGPITSLLDEIGNTGQWPRSWERHGVPRTAQDFLNGTSEVLRRGRTHEIAAAFTFGRENIIPSMFKTIVDELDNRMETLGLFSYYLKRHIDIDGEEHGPVAYRMIKRLCGENVQMWEEVTMAARASLQARITFWSALQFQIAAQKGQDRPHEPLELRTDAE